MNSKPRPNRHQCLQTLHGMTEEQRRLKAVDLSEFSRDYSKPGCATDFQIKPKRNFISYF